MVCAAAIQALPWIFCGSAFSASLKGVRMADHSEQIAAIEAILRSGVVEVVIDGQKTRYDFPGLRSELRRLRAEDDTHKGSRPPVLRVKLSGL